MCLVQEPFEVRLRHANALLLRQLVDDREIAGGEGGEDKAAAACLDRQLFAILVQIDRHAFRQRAADVEQLAPRHRQAAIRSRLDLSFRDQLDLKVGCRHGQRSLVGRQQQIGEDRHRLSPFDHADDGLQGGEQAFAFGTEFHLCTRMAGSLFSSCRNHLVY